MIQSMVRNAWEDILFSFGFYKKRRIMDAWYRGALPMPRQDNPLFQHNFNRLYGFRNGMFEKHYSSLSQEEREQLEERTHPSQSWKFEDQARTIANQLEQDLSSVDFVTRVTIGHYHLDILVLTVHLSRDPGFKTVIDTVPYLYHGFQVKLYHEYLKMETRGQGIVERVGDDQ
jgi:hypothetical protein